MDEIGVVLTVNIATLAAVLGFGYRVMRFVNFIEFRVDAMWREYEERRDATEHSHHRHQDRR